jgi:hypothetical protein
MFLILEVRTRCVVSVCSSRWSVPPKKGQNPLVHGGLNAFGPRQLPLRCDAAIPHQTRHGAMATLIPTVQLSPGLGAVDEGGSDSIPGDLKLQLLVAHASFGWLPLACCVMVLTVIGRTPADRLDPPEVPVAQSMKPNSVAVAARAPARRKPMATLRISLHAKAL